jgi:hypothetical protein
MYSLCWGDPCVHILSILVPYSSRIKGGKKDLNFGKLSVWTRNVWYPDRTSPLVFLAGIFDHCFGRNLLTVNCKSDWSHSSSASFIILLGSCFCYWKVLRSPSAVEDDGGRAKGTAWRRICDYLLHISSDDVASLLCAAIVCKSPPSSVSSVSCTGCPPWAAPHTSLPRLHPHCESPCAVPLPLCPHQGERQQLEKNVRERRLMEMEVAPTIEPRLNKSLLHKYFRSGVPEPRRVWVRASPIGARLYLL